MEVCNFSLKKKSKTESTCKQTNATSQRKCLFCLKCNMLFNPYYEKTIKLFNLYILSVTTHFQYGWCSREVVQRSTINCEVRGSMPGREYSEMSCFSKS